MLTQQTNYTLALLNNILTYIGSNVLTTMEINRLSKHMVALNGTISKITEKTNIKRTSKKKTYSNSINKPLNKKRSKKLIEKNCIKCLELFKDEQWKTLCIKCYKECRDMVEHMKIFYNKN